MRFTASAVRSIGSTAIKKVERVAVHTKNKFSFSDPKKEDFEEPKNKFPAGLQPRWTFRTIPKTAPPPSPFLPSEIKYSATLVRGQAVVHLVIGILLFIIGVLGTRTSHSAAACGSGVWCGMATIICGICGLLAHRLWYRNWAIKSYLVSTTVVLVLCVVGTALTLFYSMAAVQESAITFEYFEGYFNANNWNDTAKIKDTFFDLPPPPPNKTLVSNLVLALLVEILVASWSLGLAWKGVKAEEFTTSRREEIVKKIVSSEAPKSICTVDQETNGSMPLAAICHLLQAHPELMSSKLTWNPDRSPSRVSMDYKERVSRYLSNSQDPEPIIERTSSPESVISLTKKVPRKGEEIHAAKLKSSNNSLTSSENKDSSKRHGISTQSEKNENILSGNENKNKIEDNKITDSPNSSPMPSCSMDSSSPSSTMTRLDSSEESKDSSEESKESSKESKETENEELKKEHQSLVLSLKTFSPLATHLIKPKRNSSSSNSAVTSNGKNESKKTDELSESGKQSIEKSEKKNREFKSDSSSTEDEYKISFRHSLDRPPPLPKKEFAQPKLVTKNVHRRNNELETPTEIREKQFESLPEISNNSEKLTHFTSLDVGNQYEEFAIPTPPTEKEIKKTVTLPRKKKDKRPPPIPIKVHSIQKSIKETEEIAVTKEEKYEENVSDQQYENVEIPSDNTYENVTSKITKIENSKLNTSSKKDALAIEIKPYQSNNIQYSSIENTYSS